MGVRDGGRRRRFNNADEVRGLSWHPWSLSVELEVLESNAKEAWADVAERTVFLVGQFRSADAFC